MPCQALRNAIAISENTPSNEGSIASTVDPVGYDHYDPVMVESTARILNTIPSSHSPRTTGLAFVSPTSSTACPEYSMVDSTSFRGQASIGEGTRVVNSMRTSEMTGISVYANSDISSDTNLTSNPSMPLSLSYRIRISFDG